jgi:sterol desaturase/sphingolipid hydroxylase (fatty acid hydroxylase superfamily)
MTPALDFFVLNASGALHAIWLVWPWLLGMTLVEWVRPAQHIHWVTWLFNAFYVPVYLTVAAMALYPVAKWATPMLPTNLLSVRLDEMHWLSLLGASLVYLLMFDFFYYWFHRAQHRFPFMWRYHRFHHADVSLSAVSATRHHWSEELIRYFFMSAPLVILVGHPDAVLPWLGVVIGVDGMFIHSNIKMSLGWLGHLVVGPQYHRVHHSVDQKHFDKNFAVMFCGWDRIFGTQWVPLASDYPASGVTEVKDSNGWRLLLPWPPKDV